MTENTEVVVIGGGYAGVMAANRLTQRDDVTVTLVNPRPTFVERIRLHQLVAGSDDAVVDYRDVLAAGVRLVVDTATRIDAAERRVTLAAGGTLDYDYLVYAVGSGSADPPCPERPSSPTRSPAWRRRERLRSVLDATPADGAGDRGRRRPDRHRDRRRAGRAGPHRHPGLRRGARPLPAPAGPTLGGPAAGRAGGDRPRRPRRDGDRRDPDAVRLSDGRELPSAVTIWTAGFGVPDLAARSGLSTDAVGRLLTDETLTSVDDVRVVAAGDSAAPSDLPFRMSCQAAGPLGAQAADTVLSRIAGGRRSRSPSDSPASASASAGGPASSSSPTATTPRGRLTSAAAPGARLKEFICWGTVKQLVLEARRPGTFFVPAWAADRTRAGPGARPAGRGRGRCGRVTR